MESHQVLHIKGITFSPLFPAFRFFPTIPAFVIFDLIAIIKLKMQIILGGYEGGEIFRPGQRRRHWQLQCTVGGPFLGGSA
jgi:hypothetical protein